MPVYCPRLLSPNLIDGRSTSVFRLNPLIDGVASILIGLLLTAVAILLVRESRSLLMGETVSATESEQVRQLIEAKEGIRQVSRLRSTYLGPEEVLLQVDIRFAPDMQAGDIAEKIVEIRLSVQQACPHYRYVFVEVVR